jgi:HK97 family phage major capsid protein
VKTVVELRQERGRLIDQMQRLLDVATDEKRNLTVEEWARFDQHDLEQGRLGERIAREEPSARPGPLYAGRDGLAALKQELETRTSDVGIRPRLMDPGGTFRGRDPGEVRLLTPSESLRNYVAVDLPDGIRPEELRFGRAVRGLITGNWRHAEAERRAMGTSTIGAGGAMMPSVLSAQVLDAARAASVCFRAGAITAPMDAQEVSMARVAQDPTAAWKGENQAATASDVGLERLALRARTLVALVKASVELVEDAANAATVIETAMAAALALELDRAALRGQSAGEGPTMPLGIRGTSGVNVIAVGGSVILDHFSSAVEAITTRNGPSDGLSVVMHPRTAGTIDRFKSGDGLPLVGSPSWQALQKFTTTSVPITLSPGTATEPIVGFFPALIAGMRTELQVEASRVAADSDGSAFRNLQVWIRAYLRADVLVTRETWFSVLTGVTN